ncbi:hypothetical protein PHMEG_00040065, partial [Phytophthora megakarya]
LKSEELSLSKQLEKLKSEDQARSQSDNSSLSKKAAMTELRRRQQAEMDNLQLRQILYHRNCYIRSFKHFFSFNVEYHADLNMSKFLHSTTHLPIDTQSRLQYLETVCTDAKLDLATLILLNETESSRPFRAPSFMCKSLDVGPSGFGVTSVVVFALDTPNASNVFQVASTAIVNCGVVWPNYSLMHCSVKQMDMHTRNLKIRYSVSEHRFEDNTSGELVLLESRDISYSRLDGDGSVFLWDFVDDDDLHPLKSGETIKRSTVGALLVRSERCDNDVERVICRYICSKIHKIDSAELPPDIKRFSQSKKISALVADSMVYETIMGIISNV